MTSKSFKTYQEDLLLATYDHLSKTGLETADYLSIICEKSNLEVDEAMIYMALSSLEKQQLILYKYDEDREIEEHSIGIRLRGISKAEQIRDRREITVSKSSSTVIGGKPVNWGMWGAIATTSSVIIAILIAVAS